MGLVRKFGGKKVSTIEIHMNSIRAFCAQVGLRALLAAGMRRG